MTTSESFAIVADLNETSGGYHVLTLRIHTPFDFRYIRFNLWNLARLKYNESEERAKVGDSVKVLYENGKFLNLKSVTKVSLKECDICGTFADLLKRTTRSNTCMKCVYLPEDQKRIRVNSTVKLIAEKEKMYRYSLGISFVFVDDDRCYFAIVYENDPLFLDVKDFVTKSNYIIQGWVLSENEDGYLIKLINFEKEGSTQLSKNRKRKRVI